ncbi:MAG: hypothetical protein GXP38_16385 [Chloroflexi bacterium]|nr:hypothetical protein [Chloroflexota bacterium]
MKAIKKWSKWIVGGVAAMALVVMAATALPQTAAAQEGPGPDTTAPTRPFAHPQQHGPDQEQLLADALGITVEELQAAKQEAFDAALDQAVAEGLITQTQADFLKEHQGMARRGLGMIAPLQRFANVDIDMDALLADALGISVDDLSAARDAAREAGLEQAVADGRITQEQADMMKARHDLGEYLKEQGLPEQLRSIYEEAVQNAVEDGVITQEQADAILSQPGIGMGAPHMSRPDGFRGRGGHDAPGAKSFKFHGHGSMDGKPFNFRGRGMIPGANTGANIAPSGFSL